MELKLPYADTMSEFYRELRCTACRKLICLEMIFSGRIKFICPRCNEVSVFTFKHRLSKNDTLPLGGQDLL